MNLIHTFGTFRMVYVLEDIEDCYAVAPGIRVISLSDSGTLIELDPEFQSFQGCVDPQDALDLILEDINAVPF